MTKRLSKSVFDKRYGVSVLAMSVTASLLVGCNSADNETQAPDMPAEPVAETPVESAMQASDGTVDDQTDPVMPDVETDDLSDDVSDDMDVRDAGRHVHGAADIALALDGTVMSIELESALYNVLGFEHAPETEAQIAALTQAETRLSQPASLLQFNPEADCRAAPVDPVKLMPDIGDDHSHDHDDDAHSHDKAEDGHDHGHDHDEDHDHGDDHDHDHDHHDHVHDNALLTYSFTCSQPDELQWVDLALFDLFENLTEISVVYLGPSQQMSETLTPDNQRIQIAG